MDAPNAPNPANPNAQVQFVDAVQGPANQAQGPTVQDQAQGSAVQNQAQGPVVQIQVKVLQTTMLKLVKMCLCSLHHHKSQHNPVQLVQ